VKKLLKVLGVAVVAISLFATGYLVKSPEVESCDCSVAVEGCETVAIDVHNMLQQCEYSHEIWRERAEQCKQILQGLFNRPNYNEGEQ
jgi:hypothetical protein